MKAGIMALDDIEYFEKIKLEINQTKKEMTDFFESFGFTVYPSNANCLLIDAGKKAKFSEKNRNFHVLGKTMTHKQEEKKNKNI